MHYVYILRARHDKKLYVGSTKNLPARVKLHNSAGVPATSRRTPLDLIYYEAFVNRKDAFAREQWLKTGWGRNHVKKLLNNYLKSLGG